MKNLTALLLFSLCSLLSVAQEWVSGTIKDSRTGESIPSVHVYYEDNKKGGVAADVNGRYKIRYRVGRTLVFNAMGYEQTSVITNRAGTRNIRMREASYGMTEIVVERKRTHYKRKNNPAVELMRRVIAAKHTFSLDSMPYYSYRQYEKQTVSINDFLAKSRPNLVDSIARLRAAGADTVRGKRLDFLLHYAERCEQTGKTILPLLVEEKIKERIHRRRPEADKTFVMAQRSTGINDLLAVGGEANVVLDDVFQDVNIYENDVRLFQRHFMSPIADGAISFYRYYIEDTITVNTGIDLDSDLDSKTQTPKNSKTQKLIRVAFTPNNPQDFGFSGEMLIRADSTWQVHSCEVNIPSQSGVNFVDELRVNQEFADLPGGRRVVAVNDMVVQLSLVELLAKAQVQRTTRRTDFSFDSIPDSRFRGMAKVVTDPDAEIQSRDYWTQNRPVQLTQGEQRIDSMVAEIERVRGYQLLRFFVKAFGEGFIETRKEGGKIDIGPVNKFVSFNSIEGMRVLGGFQTTASLHPHWFFQGYLAYGLRDQRFKGKADITYSYRRAKYRPHEFPVHSVSLMFQDELMSMADRKEGENRDDLFSFIRWGRGEEYKMYQRLLALTYTRELANGLLFKVTAAHERLTPAGDLIFQPLNGDSLPSRSPDANLAHLNNTEFRVMLRYQPGNTYINSKTCRHETNRDAPIYQISHTVSPRGWLGNKFMSNVTDVELYRRLWLQSWGYMDVTLRGSYQWNKVPFLMLNSPDANQTIVMMRRRFCLMNNMEFLNDRNLSLHWKWDLAGKLFNRIPLLRRLKWRETLGCNVLWGELSDRNNPEKAALDDATLWRMPGTWTDTGEWQPYSIALDPKRPYVEVYAGVSNILRFFNVTYVHRLTYTGNPDANRWGLRIGMEFAF